MVLQLIRSKSGKKTHSIVEFPERLECLRSGPSVLTSVIQHLGEKANEGHFLATCSLGEARYAEYDDEKVCEKTFGDLQQESVRRSVYVLLYVREAAWGEGVADGSESTPYTRDALSLDMLRNSWFRSESGRSLGTSFMRDGGVVPGARGQGLCSSPPPRGDAVGASAAGAAGQIGAAALQEWIGRRRSMGRPL